MTILRFARLIEIFILQRKRHSWRVGVLCILLILISACRTDNDSVAEDSENIEVNLTQLESHLKRGLEAQNTLSVNRDIMSDNDFIEVESAPIQSSDSNVSETNVQEEGVDEADFVKHHDGYVYSFYDERIHYFYEDQIEVDERSLSISPTVSQGIRVFDLNTPSEQHEPIFDFPLESDLGQVSGLYIHQGDVDQLLLLANDWQQTIRIRGYDIHSQASEFIENLNIELPGRILNSKKIGNKLIIISRFIPTVHSPALEDFIRYPMDESQIDQNKELIENVTIDELLPWITVSDENKILLQKYSCVIPNEDEANNNADLTLITVIDLNDNSNVHSSCLAANALSSYVSKNAVYLTTDSQSLNTNGADAQEFSDVYRFKLNGNGSVEAAGDARMNGKVGYDQPFRLSEYQDHLRVITSDSQRIHRLHTLKVGDTDLTLLTSLPNEQKPAPIGKPGEAIFAVRFNQDRAYVVTYLTQDPFYVFDLSNPADPEILGELELPGFSTYLHPFNHKLVFGIGQSGDWGSGVKLALFDVADPTQPSVLNEIIVGEEGSYTPALFNHRAVSFLSTNDGATQKVAMPVSVYQSNYIWDFDGLYLLEVDLTDDKESMNLHDVLIMQSSNTGNFSQLSSYDRGILSQSNAYFIYDGKIFSQEW